MFIMGMCIVLMGMCIMGMCIGVFMGMRAGDSPGARAVNGARDPGYGHGAADD